MPRTKRGPGATQEDPPFKRGTTRRSSGSGERAPAANEDNPTLCDALGLPPRLPASTANIALMGTAGDDEDGHWRNDFEPEEHRRPRVTRPSTPLQTGNEEVEFGVAQPQEEGLGWSPIRDTARSRTGSAPPGFASRNALIALEVVDLIEEQHRARDKEKRVYARLPRLEESPKTYAEVAFFLTAIEEEGECAGLPDKLYKLAINQMSIMLATSYHRHAAIKFPGLSPTYARLVEAMVEPVAPRKPKSHLSKEIRTLEAGKMGVWPLREQLDRMYQTYFALFHRTRKVPVITERIVGGSYLRYLPEDLGAQVRDLASDSDLETLYASAKFAAARDGRRTTHPLLRVARGLSVVSGDVTGSLTVTGQLTARRDPAFADREPRAPAIAAAMEVNRAGASFTRKARDPQFLTVDERDFPIGTHGRRCPPHACAATVRPEDPVRF